jgi:hypothetical protein
VDPKVVLGILMSNINPQDGTLLKVYPDADIDTVDVINDPVRTMFGDNDDDAVPYRAVVSFREGKYYIYVSGCSGGKSETSDEIEITEEQLLDLLNRSIDIHRMFDGRSRKITTESIKEYQLEHSEKSARFKK